MNYKKIIAPTVAVIIVASGSIFFYRTNKNLKKEYNDLVDEYNEILAQCAELDALNGILKNDVDTLAAENAQLSADADEVQQAYDDIRGHEIEGATGEEVVDEELAEMRRRYAAGPQNSDEPVRANVETIRRSNEGAGSLSQRLRANLEREQAEVDAQETSMQALSPKEHREKHNSQQARQYTSAWDTEVVLDPSDDQVVDHEEWQKKREEILRKEEDMQYDINSEEALEAYKNMVLLEYRDINFEQAGMQTDIFRLENQLTPLNFNQAISALDQLFAFTGYGPSNVYDQNAFEWALAEREEFFTVNSKYAQPEEVSFAEILIYWVNQLQEDYEFEHLQWAFEFMNNIDIFNPNNTADTIGEIIASVLRNDYIGEDGRFGLFGLFPEDDFYGYSDGNNIFNQMQTYAVKLSEYLDEAQIGFQDEE